MVYIFTIVSNLLYSLAGQNQPEHLLMWQVQLVPDSLTGGQIVQGTCSAPECLCHHQVIPVDVQNLPSPLVDTVACQLLPTSWAEYPHPPQVVGHPHHQPMGEETVGSWCLVVNEGWDRGLVPQLQIWPQFAGVKEGAGNPPLVLHRDGFAHFPQQIK